MNVLRFGLLWPIVILAAVGLIYRHPSILWLIPIAIVAFVIAAFIWVMVAGHNADRRRRADETRAAQRDAVKRLEP